MPNRGACSARTHHRGVQTAPPQPLRVISHTREVMGFSCHLPAEHPSDRKIFNTWANANSNNLGPLCPVYADICVWGGHWLIMIKTNSVAFPLIGDYNPNL